MNILKSPLLFILLLTIAQLNAQQFHANVIAVDTCANYLVLDQTPEAGFAEAGVFFFVLQHNGAEVMTDDNENFGSLTQLNGAGRYELNRISVVIGDTIFARSKLRHDYLTAANATSITLSPPQTGPVTSPLSATPFNGQNGGVLLLGSDNTLTIGAELNASGAGYAGGIAEIWDSQCNAFTSANDYFYAVTNWRGAYKGNGAALAAQFVGKETGRGPALNGGGGGNDHNSGGGGGANITGGGDGSPNLEPGLFNCNGNFPGLGGIPLPTTQDGSQRVYFGGGGGAGHGNNNNPTAGGNGGGIIVLAAPQITFQNDPLLNVAGQNAELVDGDGGGGGGAGGSILLFSESINSDVHFDISGGDGASVTNNGQNRCFGPGGGGAGGRFLYAGPPVAGWTLTVGGGTGGESLNSQACDPGENVADNGATGITEAGIQLPISIQEALNYPDQAIITDSFCLGSGLTIGRPDDASCFAAQWFIATPNAYESLNGNPDYGPTNGPALNILSLPTPAIGNSVEYRLERYGRTGEIIAVLTVLVPILPEPVAAFTFSSNELTANFSNNSSGSTTYFWQFGDGNTSALPSPQHAYASSGTYEVRLIATGPCGADTLTQQIVIIATMPVAIIEGLVPAICLGDTLKLINRSENAMEIVWDASQPNVVILPDVLSDTVCVVGLSPGLTNILLCATNLDQENCSIQLLSVTDFPNYNISTTVNGNQAMAIASGDWGFNNFWILPSGDTITGDTLVNIFPGPGDYEITFVASNGACPDQIQTVIISIFDPTFPSIGASFSQGCTPFNAQFFNETTGPVDSILWTSEVASPTSSRQDTATFTFAEAGIFDLVLTVYSPNGTLTDTIQIEVFSSPTVNFTLEETDGLLVTTNLSTDASSYQWNFGDGNGSTMFEPIYQYQSTGTFDVTLNAFNAACNRASSQTLLVDFVSKVEELAALGIRIFPNPVTRLLQLEGPVEDWMLMDVAGRSLIQKQNGQLHQIDLAELPAGTYYLKIQVDGRELSLAVQKQ